MSRHEPADLLQGTLDMLILKVAALEPIHGYAIVQCIQRRSDDILAVEEGSLYPALYRMEEKGWISAEWGRSENNRRAKFYSLTRAGRKQLVVLVGSKKALSLAVQRHDTARRCTALALRLHR